jgi:hypothetical protein
MRAKEIEMRMSRVRRVPGGFGLGLAVCSLIILVVSFPARVSGGTRRVLTQDATQLDAAFAAADRAATVEDLIREAKAASYNTTYVREGLFYAAALVSTSERFVEDASLTKRAIKGAVFATLLELAAAGEISKWPKDEQLYSIGPSGLTALEKYLNFAREGDPINIMLRRMPSIDGSEIAGEYRFLRLNFYLTGRYVLLESADTPWLDLSPRWKKSEGALGPEARSKSVPVEGLFYAFPLASIRFIVAIEKAYLCLSLLPSDTLLKKYALLLAGDSFYFASRASGSDESYKFAGTASDILRVAVEAFRRQPPAGGALLTADNLLPRLTAARFFARKFRVALEDYNAAANALNRPADFRVYGEWGAAICLLGMGNTTGAATRFRNVAMLLQKATPALDNSQYRYLMLGLIDTVGAKAVLGDQPQLDYLHAAAEAWRGTYVPEDTRYRLNLNLLQALYTVGRHDIAARFLMREIARVHKRAEIPFRVIELDYMKELGATLGDVYSELSWTMDEGGNVKPRLANMQEWSRDFAPTKLDKFLSGCFGTSRYGTCSPEEDRATAVQTYAPDAVAPFEGVYSQLKQLVGSGLIESNVMDFDFNSISPAPKTDHSGIDIARWVEEEFTRTPPNVEPLLKLVWIEWCYLPLAELGLANSSLSTWRYRPLNNSGLTSASRIELKLKSTGQFLDPRTQRVWELFRDVHEFLLNNYGENIHAR